MAPMQLHWDIFCRVIDNYGDIGICWRLARQLAAEHSRQVRLWVDDLGSLQPLCPVVDPACERQWVQGVEIRHWRDRFPAAPCAEVVIEAFACDLPEVYQQEMAKAERKPCWVNLEYLTAEAWAEEWHGMASPHPTLPLTKYFFFPGFSRRSGGLLRESGLLTERDAFLERVPPRDHLEFSLFCYDTAPVGVLLDALAVLPKVSVIHVPPGKPLQAVTRHLGGTSPWQHGQVRIEAIPFLPLDAYDRLLWQCDINFVRGEDSFVRAQWAGKPFVWQIYAQDEKAHLAKLAAFLDRYCASMDPDPARITHDLFAAWNGEAADLATALRSFIDKRDALAKASLAWSQHLATQDDLASTLVKFCATRV